MDEFKIDDIVERRSDDGCTDIGTIVAIDWDYATVQWEHSGTITVEQLEILSLA